MPPYTPIRFTKNGVLIVAGEVRDDGDDLRYTSYYEDDDDRPPSRIVQLAESPDPIGEINQTTFTYLNDLNKAYNEAWQGGTRIQEPLMYRSPASVAESFWFGAPEVEKKPKLEKKIVPVVTKRKIDL
jgi:hypothetical protein